MRFWSTVAIGFLLVAATATAQDRPSPYVSGSISAANMESRTDIAFGASAGYRFNHLMSLMIEMTGVPELRSSFPDDEPITVGSGSTAFGSTGSTPPRTTQVFPSHPLSEGDGRVLLFTNNARIEFPTLSPRVTPFFMAGGGVGNVRHRVDFIAAPDPLAVSGDQTSPSRTRQPVEGISSSSTNLALTIGGGVGIHVASSVWLDADLRLFRLFGDEDRNLGRFGVGVRYAF